VIWKRLFLGKSAFCHTPWTQNYEEGMNILYNFVWFYKFELLKIIKYHILIISCFKHNEHMLNFIKKLFGKKEKETPPIEFSSEEYERDYELKNAGLEYVLGEMHDTVGHAIIPFAIGGAVDMYYFPHHIDGTGFATMELLEPDGTGPLPNRLGTYELVAFTKHKLNTDNDTQTSFNVIERHICGIFTKIGFYSRQAVLNPNETCELPNGDEEENTCLILDLYEPDQRKFKIGDRNHHLLLCLHVFKSEMDFARMHGSSELFKKLKAANYYPFSDLDRDPVA
jgi:hypothetical protein